MTLWLRLVSVLVPRDRRAAWLIEWRAELAHDAHAGRAGAHDTASVARGALAHALWLRRLEWSFAMKDFRYALRLARRSPGLSAVIVGTLALGIGAATAMFSIVNGVLIKPLPYPESDRLVYGYGDFRHNDSASVSPLDFLDYRERNDVFETLGAMMTGPSGVTVEGPDGPTRLRASVVTAGVITALGVPPARGRDFTREEERSTGPPAVVISDRLWRQWFGGRENVIGESLVVNSTPLTVVGVMPPGFRLPHDASVHAEGLIDLILPFPFDTPPALVRGYHFLRVVGRLQTGTSLEAAQSHMDVIARQLEAAYPESNETWRLRLLPLQEELVGGVRDTLVVMMAAVMVVLLIACANVAGLLLARASARQGEVAVRRALGASRARVVRQFLMEGFVFAAAGSAAGLLVALWAVDVVKRVSPGNLPRLDDVALDPAVVAFALVAGIGTTLLFALLPALQSAGAADAASIRDGARTAGSRRTSRLRGAIVVGEVAMATMLLIGAGLLVRSFSFLTSVDPGFDAGNVLVARVSLPAERYGDRARIEQFQQQLTQRIASAPGVDAVAMTTTVPLTGGNDILTYPEGRPPATQADRRFPQVRWVRGAYFEAAGIPIVQGRALDDTRDTPSTPPVAVISQAMAARHFPGVDPIGRRLIADFSEPITAEIVGIAGDTRDFGQDAGPPDMFYLSARQFPTDSMSLVVRTSTPAAGFAPVLRGALRELDPALALGPISAMTSLLSDSVARPRFRAGLIVSFAAVALALTVVGLYGTLAFAVSQRTREIGIRFALGARSASVLGMVLRQGIWLVAAGAALGLAGGLAASRLLEDMLFEVAPRDVTVFVAVPVLVAAVAVIAMLAPARRAARVDPVKALRS